MFLAVVPCLAPVLQVTNAAFTGCSTCSTLTPGTVKVPDVDHTNLSQNVTCEPARGVSYCGSNQYSLNGRCTPCGLGKVPNLSNTGCDTCPPGEVRLVDNACICIHTLALTSHGPGSNKNRKRQCAQVKFPDSASVVDAWCASAGVLCLDGQYSSGGRCTSCTWGQVRAT